MYGSGGLCLYPRNGEKMDKYTRHKRVYRFLQAVLRRWFCRKFNLTAERFEPEGPALVICNHVTAYDPVFVGLSFGGAPLYFVASEHLFRLGPVTKLLVWLVEPIPRRKAASSVDTVKACLKHLREGRSVCLFAEGEQSWDGLGSDIFPSTGKLARHSGAMLVTMRIEGGYLSFPRWGKGIRRGRVTCRPVNVYTPEQLKKMKPDEIDAAINRDIYENFWERQNADPVEYRGRRRAEGLERMLYMCPSCGKTGGLGTKKDRIFCTCGMETRFAETGFFEPDKPFRNLAEWDEWERGRLKERDFPHGELLFSDGGVTLVRLDASHGETILGRGELRQYEDRLCFEELTFLMDDISDMAMVLSRRLLFSHGDEYYEARSDGRVNLRKYYEFRKVR